MKTIYCISGLGADERAFSKLSIEGYTLQCIPWLQPLQEESLQDYAGRMKAGITTTNPILLGLSFGGIMCIEIAKQLPVQKIIIISSIKSSMELPLWMRAVAKLSLHKLFPLRSTKLTAPFQNLFLGVTNAEDKKIAEDYRRRADIKYVKWAVDKVLNWKNDWVHPHTIHIHGNKDRMFSLKKIKADHIIKGGGHFMIMNKAPEVSGFINTVLQNNSTSLVK